MNRHSVQRPDRIEYGAWVVVDATGGLKLTRAKPSLTRGEVAIALELAYIPLRHVRGLL